MPTNNAPENELDQSPIIYNPEIIDKIEHIIATGKRTNVTHMSSEEFKTLLQKIND